MIHTMYAVLLLADWGQDLLSKLVGPVIKEGELASRLELASIVCNLASECGCACRVARAVSRQHV